MINIILLLLTSLITGLGVSAVINFFLLVKFNAGAFLKAGKKLLLINPTENKRLSFIVSKNYGGLAETKNGYYRINPDHIYIDEKSKVPCAFVYGKESLSISPKMSNVADKLKEVGINDANELATLIKKLGKEKKKKDYVVNLLGESVSIHNVPAFFWGNERSDLIESEIQRRTAVQAMQKMKPSTEVLKYLIYFTIIIMVLAIVYKMITMGGDGGGTISTDQLKQALQNVNIASQIQEGASSATSVE